MQELQQEMVDLMQDAGVPRKYIGHVDVIRTEDFCRWYPGADVDTDKPYLLVYQDGGPEYVVDFRNAASEKLKATFFMLHYLTPENMKIVQ